MSKYCVNTQAPEFQTLVARSGLPELFVKASIAAHLELFGPESWPQLDQIANANSEETLKKDFQLSSMKSANIADILIKTKTDSLLAAVPKINNIYRDLEISISPVDNKGIFNIERRPSPFEFRLNPTVIIDEAFHSNVYIILQLERLASLYGININTVSNNDLLSMGFLEEVPEYAQIAAFVKDGLVYVNTDVANIDAPMHELMHIFMGGIKYSNPNIYYNLVELMQNVKGFEDFAKSLPNRALSDICEEMFVLEFSKYLAGMQSILSEVDPAILANITYEVSRTLDTILMGDNSVRLLPEASLAMTSLRNLGKIVNASNLNSSASCFVDGAVLNRIMANTKRELMRKGDLREECK